ncbi:hypothetical protein [Viridibacillus arvi]
MNHTSGISFKRKQRLKSVETAGTLDIKPNDLTFDFYQLIYLSAAV